MSDLLDGLYRLLLSEEVYPVNLGNPREMTIREFAKAVLRQMSSWSPITYMPLSEDDPQQRQPDITKARTLLGWEPQVRSEEGFGRDDRVLSESDTSSRVEVIQKSVDGKAQAIQDVFRGKAGTPGNT